MQCMDEVPRVPLNVFFPDNHVQDVLKWTNFVLNLSKHIEDIHEEIVKHEQSCEAPCPEVEVLSPELYSESCLNLSISGLY